jgi:hypothetical protein
MSPLFLTLTVKVTTSPSSGVGGSAVIAVCEKSGTARTTAGMAASARARTKGFTARV